MAATRAVGDSAAAQFAVTADQVAVGESTDGYHAQTLRLLSPGREACDALGAA